MSRKFILTVDGGGIRCLIAATVLVEIERRLRLKGCTQPMHQLFDMMAGVGIGSLIAAALSCPTPGNPSVPVSTPSEIVRLFKSENHFVFTQAPVEGPGAGPYNPLTLETVLKMRFGDKTVMTQALTKLLIPAYDILNRTPLTFGNVDQTAGNFYVWQALRAACSDPTCFAPAMVENLAKARPRGTPLLPLINGGSVGNDPALAAFVAATTLGWAESGSEMVVLSLGSGLDRRPIPYFHAESVGSHGPALAGISPSQVVPSQEFDSPAASQINLLMNRNAHAFNGTSTRVTAANRERLSYYRINGALENASIAVDDVTPQNIHLLQDEAARIVIENSAVIDAFVERLVASQAGPRPAPQPAVRSRSTSEKPTRMHPAVNAYQPAAIEHAGLSRRHY